MNKRHGARGDATRTATWGEAPRIGAQTHQLARGGHAEVRRGRRTLAVLRGDSPASTHGIAGTLCAVRAVTFSMATVLVPGDRMTRVGDAEGERTFELRSATTLESARHADPLRGACAGADRSRPQRVVIASGGDTRGRCPTPDHLIAFAIDG
jgi:hypothetical protein